MASPTISLGAARRAAHRRSLPQPIFPPIISRPASAPVISSTRRETRGSAGSSCSTSIAIVLSVRRAGSPASSRRLHEVNLLAPIELGLAPFASVGLTYVLHCLPGRMSEKLAAVDHLRPLMQKGAVLFGATILGRGIAPNRAARTLLDLYNAKGVFNNREDDMAALRDGLRRASMRSRSRAKAASRCSARRDQRFVRGLHRHDYPVDERIDRSREGRFADRARGRPGSARSSPDKPELSKPRSSASSSAPIGRSSPSASASA